MYRHYTLMNEDIFILIFKVKSVSCFSLTL